MLRSGPPWPQAALWSLVIAVVLVGAAVLLARAGGDAGLGAAFGAVALLFAFAFAGLAAHVVTLPIPGHDSRDPAELAGLAEAIGLTATPCRDLDEALASVTRPARVLVFGSLYLAGVALESNGTLPD